MGTQVPTRERKVRCFICHHNKPESLTTPIRRGDVVKSACKEHNLVSDPAPASPPTIEEELRTRIKVLEAIVDRRSNAWRDNEEERAKLEAAIRAADPTVDELKTVLREQTRHVEYAVAILDNEMYDRRVRLCRAELIEALEITAADYGLETTL